LEVKQLQQIVEQYFSENAINDCFWVDAKVLGKKIEVFIDKDGGISYDMCHKVSRHIEAILDAGLQFGPSYTLDVSSPGIGTPLKLPRQYVNNIGRQIEVKYEQKKKVKGLLKDANDGFCVVTEETTVKEGNKKRKVNIDHEIKYVDIIEAKIKISF
jgi:ribosome maturation factor RimP